MEFFRKYFVPLAMGLVGIAALAYILPAFFPDKEPEMVQSSEIEEVEIEFSKEAEVLIFKQGELVRAIEVELADTPNERALGLMYRKGMAENQGMLFLFPEEEPRSFYMKNTEFPLDIIYLNKDLQIVSIVKNAKPYDESSMPSEAPAMYVLEINGGLSDKWGISAGDSITYQLMK